MGGILLKAQLARRDPNMVAMLSLYLLLLAFFILLNALSKLEDDRTRMVLESVNAAFDGRVESVASVRSHPAGLGSLRDATAMLSDLRKLFQSSIPAAVTETAAEGPVMRLTLAAESLFRPGRKDLQPGRGLLLDRLSEALLSQQNAALQFEIDLLHGVPEARSDVVAEAGPRSLEVRRVGSLVRYLEDRDLPPGQLSIGIAPGHPGLVQIVIRVFEESAEPVALDQRGE